MTIVVEPTHGDGSTDSTRGIDSLRLATAISKGISDYVVPAGTDLLATLDSDLSTTSALNGFGIASTSGLTVTIDTGEAAFSGHYLASDDTTVTDSVDGTVAHEVDLPSNSTSVIRLFVDRTRTDRLIFDLDSNVTLAEGNAPSTELFEVTTDGTGVTNTTDLRATTPEYNLKNQRYEGSNPQAVKQATNSQFIRDIGLGALARADSGNPQALARVYAFNGHSGTNGTEGTVGMGDGETARFGGTTSDLTANIQGGFGRFVLAWNAYWDQGNGVWRSIVASEDHSLIGWNISEPGGSSSGRANIVLGFGKSNPNADDPVDWETRSWDEGGTPLANGTRMNVVPIRSSAPASSDIPRDSTAMWVEQ